MNKMDNEVKVINLAAADPREVTLQFPQLPRWDVEKLTGYKPQTTFWQDFSIAEVFGVEAVLETFERAFAEWINNAAYITELSMVLNHKIHAHHQQRPILARAYRILWERLHNWALDNLTGEDIEYYVQVTD